VCLTRSYVQTVENIRRAQGRTNSKTRQLLSNATLGLAVPLQGSRMRSHPNAVRTSMPRATARLHPRPSQRGLRLGRGARERANRQGQEGPRDPGQKRFQNIALLLGVMLTRASRATLSNEPGLCGRFRAVAFPMRARRVADGAVDSHMSSRQSCESEIREQSSLDRLVPRMHPVAV